MRRELTAWCVLTAIGLLGSTVLASDAQWRTSYTDAVKESKATGKPILADFTGSDW